MHQRKETTEDQPPAKHLGTTVPQVVMADVVVVVCCFLLASRCLLSLPSRGLHDTWLQTMPERRCWIDWPSSSERLPLLPIYDFPRHRRFDCRYGYRRICRVRAVRHRIVTRTSACGQESVDGRGAFNSSTISPSFFRRSTLFVAWFALFGPACLLSSWTSSLDARAPTFSNPLLSCFRSVVRTSRCRNSFSVRTRHLSGREWFAL